MPPAGRLPAVLVNLLARLLLAALLAEIPALARAQPASVAALQCIERPGVACILELARLSAPDGYDNNPQLLLALSRAARAAGDGAAATASYQRAAAMTDPRQLPTADFSRFVGYFVDFHIAIGNLAKAEQLAIYTPYDTERAYRLIGIYSVHQARGQADDAARVLGLIQTVVKIVRSRETDHFNVSRRLAMALTAGGRTDEAKALLAPLLAHSQAARTPQLAEALAAAGDYRGASALADKAEDTRQQAKAHALIAIRATQRGARDIAAAALARAQRLSPPGRDSSVDLAITEALLAREDLNQAFDRAERTGGGGGLARLDQQFALSACIRHVARRQGPKKALAYLERLPGDMGDRARFSIIEEALKARSYSDPGDLVEIASGIEAKRLRMLAYAGIAAGLGSDATGTGNP